jgi:hypothetical protein
MLDNAEEEVSSNPNQPLSKNQMFAERARESDTHWGFSQDNSKKNPLRRINDKILSHLKIVLPPQKYQVLDKSIESARLWHRDTVQETRPFLSTIKDRFRSLVEEPGLFASLVSIELGQASKGYAEARGNRSPIGNMMVEGPLALQAGVELRKFIETNADHLSQNNIEAQEAYEELASSFGIDTNSRLFKDPKLVEYMRKSFMLWPAYGEVVKYTGIPIQAALSALFIMQPEVNQFVSQNAMSVDIGAIAATGALLIWRAKQEELAIKEKGYNPDFMQTAPVILTSSIDGEGHLKRDIKKWVWIINGVDLAKVTAIYTLPFAWNEHLLAAALLTNATDMIYHGGFNLAFRKNLVGKVKDKFN